MRKSIKSFILILVVVFGVLQLPIMTFAASNIPSATNDFYVNDFADVFSTDEKARLMDNAVALSNEHDDIQVVVSTVKSLDGDTVENYALQMYNQYGIGKNDMGILILLSTEDRKIRIEVGRAMESYINDSKAGDLIDDYAIPSLKKDKFNEGLISLQEALIDEIITSITKDSSNISSNHQSVQVSTKESHLNFLNFLGIVLIVVIIGAIIIFAVILIRKIIAKSNEKQQTIALLTEKLERSEQRVVELQETIRSNERHFTWKISSLSSENNKLSSDYHDLDTKLKSLEDRYRRVQILYPKADSDVSEMIAEEIRQKDMALAAEVDSCIQKLLPLSPNKDLVPDLKAAKSSYQNLSKTQQSYVTSDISNLNHLYDESQKLKIEYDKMMEEQKNKKLAVAAAASITGIIAYISIGKAKDLKALKQAQSIYNNLDSGAKPYFDKSIIDKLNRLLSNAKHDKKKQDEEEARRKRREEERRKRMQSSSSSSFGGGSHFGGHSGGGGRSGGGGASRGF